ncbi:MAG: hypothetical protein ACK53Y_06640, partial [bacterium]
MAQGHQESARGRDKDHTSGSDTTGPRPKCHRGLPDTTEAVQRTTIRTARGRGRDAGVRQVEERAGERESPSAGRDHRMAGLEQGAAIRDERVGGLRTDTPGSDRA